MKKAVVLLTMCLLMAAGSINVEAKLYDGEDKMFEDLQLEIMLLNKRAKPVDIPEEEYKTMDYNDIMREREGKVDVRHTFYATVQQYEEVAGADMAYALFKRDGDINQVYYVFFPKAHDKRIMEGDRVDVYGNLKGILSYDTVMGGKKTVPLMFAEKALIEGVDY